MKVPDVPVRILTHNQKVCSLYKRALRNLRSIDFMSFHRRELNRYNCVMLRQRFEKNRDCSEEKARQLLIDGENELWRDQAYSPMVFANSYGGLLYERSIDPPDWVLDYWHPLEKLQYPEYFARREERKKEFIKMWDDSYGEKKKSKSQERKKVAPPKKNK